MFIRYFAILATLLSTYYLQFFYAPVRDVTWLASAAAVVFGFACAQVGLLPLHDASHCALTKNQWVWRILGASHDFVNGASYLNWCYQHMLGHHPYTNVRDADPDLTTAEPDFRRIKESQKWYPRYLNQEWFVPMMYGFLGVKTRIQDVTILFMSKMNDNIRVNPVVGWHFYAFWLGKVAIARDVVG